MTYRIKWMLGLGIAACLAVLTVYAATTLNSQVGVSLNMQLSGPASVGTAQYSPGLTALLNATLANGTNADHASKVSANAITLASGAGEVVDLYAPGTDPLGNTISFSKIRLMVIQILGNAGVFNSSDFLTIGGNGASTTLTTLLSPNTSSLTLRSGTANMPGTLLLSDGGTNGWAVSSGVHFLCITNGGSNSITFNRIFVGE